MIYEVLCAIVSIKEKHEKSENENIDEQIDTVFVMMILPDIDIAKALQLLF